MDNNNETILASTEGYNTKQGCLNGIDSVKKHSPYDQSYRKFPGADLKYYFTLQASNGEAIGKSEGYNTSSGRDRGIDNCKKEAPYAGIRELTSYSV
jgi:uncharacterized protein YegP (UPF0339 family)